MKINDLAELYRSETCCAVCQRRVLQSAVVPEDTDLLKTSIPGGGVACIGCWRKAMKLLEVEDA